MGAIVGKLQRRIRRFNIDNRARAIISKDKPTPAPQYEATKKQLELAQEISPDFLENHYRKNIKLDEHLKTVYVTSTKPKEDIFSKPNTNRPLPMLKTSEDLEFGFYMPNEAPAGKCTLVQIFNLLTQHKDDPIKYNADALATQYKLDKETVDKLLEYYKLYYLHIPQKEPKDDSLQLKLTAIANKFFHETQKKKE